MSAKAHSNPKILRWMRERGGLDVGDAAHAKGTDPLPFVARFAIGATIPAVAADMRAVFGIDVENGQCTWDG